MATVLGVLKNPTQTVGAIESLKGAGFGDLEVFSPVPSHQIEQAFDPRPSGVRGWTLIGGRTGGSLGYLMTIGMSYDWELVIGLEVHAQVASNAKLFSGASTTFGAEPNSNVAFVDAAPLRLALAVPVLALAKADTPISAACGAATAALAPASPPSIQRPPSFTSFVIAGNSDTETSTPSTGWRGASGISAWRPLASSPPWLWSLMG